MSNEILKEAGWDRESNSNYWKIAWEDGIKQGERFDCCYSVPVLQDYMRAGKIPNGRALIPGCGRGYDVALLASPDREVIGIDIVPFAVETARNYISTLNIPQTYKWSVETVDFFNYDEKFDFIFDYTFLCALDPSMRTKWAETMFSLLKPGGQLMTLIFPIPLQEDELTINGPSLSGNPSPAAGSAYERQATARTILSGPPFAVSFEIVRDLCEGAGLVALEEPRMLQDVESHPHRQGRSGVAIWKKKE